MNPLKLHRSSLVLYLVLPICLFLQTVYASPQQAASLPGQFAYVEDGKRLYLVRGDVQDPLLVLETQNQETVGFPRFSRDGRHLAYCLSTPSIGALPAVYELDTLTFENNKVTTDGSCSYDWSPDGKTLIYSTPPALDAPSTLPNGIWAYTRETGACSTGAAETTRSTCFSIPMNT